MLDATEKAFDQVSITISTAVVLPGRDAVGTRRDNCLGARCFDTHNQRVGVVPFVGNQAGIGHADDQIVRALDVGHLPCRQDHTQRLAQGIDGEVQFGRQAASGAPECLRAGFFLAPEACWWARTMVESMNTCARSRSPAKAKAIRSQTPPSRQRAKRTYAEC